MAYGLIYKLRVGSRKWANDVVVEILKDGYTGISQDKYLGSGGINLSKEDGGVICGTSLSFAIQADSNLEYVDFFELPTRTFQVILKLNNIAFWTGYIISDEYSEEFRDPPYDVAVKATDGLGLLKNVDYVIETNKDTRISRFGVITKILDTIGLTLPISIGYDVSVTSVGNIFANARITDDYYDGWTCYEVLEKMIPPDATLTQHKNKWLIRRNERDSKKNHIKYTPAGGGTYLETTELGETALALAPKGSGDVYPIGVAELQMLNAWKSLSLTSEHGKRASWLRNNNFKDGLVNWDADTIIAPYVETLFADGIYYLRIDGWRTKPDEGGSGAVYTTIPFVSVPGAGFYLSYKVAVIGYDRIEDDIFIPYSEDVHIRVSITDGINTYYLNPWSGWITDSDIYNWSKRIKSSPGVIEWNPLEVFADSPPISGTLKIELFRINTHYNEPYHAVVAVAFTDINVRTINVDELNSAVNYKMALRSNATEAAEITIMPTDVPADYSNFSLMFYNVHETAAGEAILSLTDGVNVNSWTNLILNNLAYLHSTTRHIIRGRFRGADLTLNSVISCAASGNKEYVVKSGEWNLYDDSISAELVEIPSGSVANTDYASSGEQVSQQTSGSGGSTSTVIIGSGVSGSYLPLAIWNDLFEIVDEGLSTEYVRCKRTLASIGEIIAYNTASPTGTFWDNLPVASTTVLGGVKVDGTTITIVGGVITAIGGGSGVSDHGALTGLADDDHPQYLNNTRGDARYQPLDADLTDIAALTGSYGVPNKNNGVWELKDDFMTLADVVDVFRSKQAKDADLTAIAAISETAGYLKKTAAETWTLDNSTFLTAITKSMVEAVLTGAITSHTHDYEGSISKSTGYLTWNGTAWAWKNETYALSSHNHDTLYEPKLTKSTGYLRWTGSTWEFKNETYLTAITKALVEAVLTGTITSHNHSGVYEPAITKSLGLLYWNGTAWAFDTNSYALASHNHSGVYQPLDADLTAIAGQTGTGFLKRTGTNTWGMAANGANIDTINQDLATDDDVHFNSVDVEDLEVGEIIDGILQTGYGANLLRYSSEFESALWTKSDCTATDNSVDSPFSGSTVKGCYILVDSSNPLFQQAVGNTNTGNHTFSIWLRSSGGNTAVTLKLYTNTQSHAGISVTATTSWQRFSVTNTLSTAHTTKYVRVEWSTQDLDVWGAQLEIGSTAGRYTHTESLVGGGSGAHIYDNLRVAGNLYASDIRAEGNIVATGEVTAYSDARLKNNIRPTDPALERLNKIEVVDYRMNGDTSGRVRTGVIAQQIISLFPQMVEGSEMDYYSVNYGKLVSVAIKAIQELTEKVERLEKILKENGITHD